MDELNREYGVLLGVTGPRLMERAYWFRNMAKRIEKEAPDAAAYMEMQALRAEETVDALAKGFDNARS